MKSPCQKWFAAALLGGIAVFAAQTTAGTNVIEGQDSDSPIALVVRQIAIEEADHDECADQVHFSLEFEATYEVLEVIRGSFVGETITFAAYDHYGFPSFALWDTVLIYVLEVEDGFVHDQYLFHPVFPTATGEWAACGQMYWRRRGLDKKLRTRSTEFVPVQVAPLRNGADFDALYPPRLFLREGSTVKCKKGGVSATRLFEMDRRGVLAARAEYR